MCAWNVGHAQLSHNWDFELIAFRHDILLSIYPVCSTRHNIFSTYDIRGEEKIKWKIIMLVKTLLSYVKNKGR